MGHFQFIDGDTGEVLDLMIPSSGYDVGDKGIFKAITGALKYIMKSVFLVPEEGDDPEDEKVDKEEGKKAANAVAVSKLKDMAKGDLNIVCTQTGGPGTDYEITGGAVAIARAEMTGEQKGSVGWAQSGNKTLIGCSKFFEFKDMCAKFGLTVTLADAPSGTTKAVIPPFVPVAERESTSTDPILEKVEAVERPGKKWFFSVTWNGAKHTSFDKGAFGILKAAEGNPAMLEVSQNGKYSNLKRVLRLDGIDFSDSQEQPPLIDDSSVPF